MTQNGFTTFGLAAALALSPPAGPTLAEESKPAVSDVNGKIAIAGGVIGDDGTYLIDGSVSFPVTHEIGVQVDGLIGTVDGDGVGGGAAHVFWRDPEQALAGIYVSGLASTAGGNYQVGNVGAEGALYLGQFAVEGVAGLQISDVRSAEVFGSIGLAYYPVDDLRVYAAYRHWFGQNEAGFGAEWQLPGQNDDSLAYAIYADGRLREDDQAVIVGVRIYFGAQKSLIRRHREDDPIAPLVNDLFSASTVPNPAQGSAAAPQPPEEPACDVATGQANDAFIAQQQQRAGGSSGKPFPLGKGGPFVKPTIIWGC